MSEILPQRRYGGLARFASRLRAVWHAQGPWRFPWVLLVGCVRPVYAIAVRRIDDGLPDLPMNPYGEPIELESGQIQQLADAHPSASAQTMRRYLDQGARCIVWWIDGVPAHWRWETDREIYLPYLRATVRPEEGVRLTVEVFTHPRFRKRGLFARASLRGLHDARDKSYRRVVGLVASWNLPVHGARLTRTGFKFEGRVGVWLLGPWHRHFASGRVPFEIDPN